MCEVTVLSYHDTSLKNSDLSLLEGPRWLNDRIIAFYFEYLEYEVFSEQAEQLCFVTPEVVQLVKLCEGIDLSMFPNLQAIPDKELVFLAVNDNQNATSVGGSHWSLLVYIRRDHTFFHYDSSLSSNSAPARLIARRLEVVFKGRPTPKFVEVNSCPQQTNGYDCGVYMLCFTKAICEAHLKGLQLESLLKTVDADRAVEWRSKIYKTIVTLSTSLNE